jgi:ER lumen protein retaining receptor
MNIFRFLGDLSHLASIFILLQKIQTSRSCRGISFKTQALYLAVFLTRYVDLLTGPYVSFYNTVMKLFFIGSTAYTLYLMRVRFRRVAPQSDLRCSSCQADAGRIAGYLPAVVPHSPRGSSGIAVQLRLLAV